MSALMHSQLLQYSRCSALVPSRLLSSGPLPRLVLRTAGTHYPTHLLLPAEWLSSGLAAVSCSAQPTPFFSLQTSTSARASTTCACSVAASTPSACSSASVTKATSWTTPRVGLLSRSPIRRDMCIQCLILYFFALGRQLYGHQRVRQSRGVPVRPVRQHAGQLRVPVPAELRAGGQRVHR